MRSFRMFVAAAAVLALAACAAPQKTLYVDAYPQGATLIEADTGNQHLTPATISYYEVIPEHMDANGCVHVKPFTAVWPSGVRRTISGLRIPGNANDSSSSSAPLDTSGLKPLPQERPILLCGEWASYTINVKRPDAPGLEYDLAVAREQAIAREIRRLKGETALAEGLGTFVYGATCAASDGCPREQHRPTNNYSLNPPPPSISQAQTRCSTDSFGNTTCRNSDGGTWRGSVDSFGNETWQNNQGDTVRGSTDSFGNTTYRDNQGNTLRGTTDSFGNETWRDNQGNTIRGNTDSFGNTTYRDNQGNTTRCSTDSFGNTTCR